MPDVTKLTIEELLDDDESFLATDIRVGADGRLTIPADKRDYYDVEYNDIVHLIIYTAGEGFVMLDRHVDSHGRVSIPASKLDRYELDTGDRVDIAVIPSRLARD